MTALRHRIVIIGGGTAGVTVAARLRRAGLVDVALIEPSDRHWYQPLWSLVGGGLVDIERTWRPEASVVPQGVAWLRDSVDAVDPDASELTTSAGVTVRYDHLVLAPGIECDWDAVPGLTETLGQGGVSSNYRHDLAVCTWEFVRGLRGGTALFTMPTGPIKCGGAPQKIAYLAADWWRQQGVLRDIRVVLVLPTPALFGLPQFAAVLERVVERYGIEVHLDTELAALKPDRHEATVVDRSSGLEGTLRYDIAHVVPPQRAPAFVRRSKLADASSAHGYAEVDKHTLRHVRYPNVFALGDAANTPNSKTGAAVRKQAPVLVENLRAALDGNVPTARYDGYGSCPFVTARNRAVLAEFDYELNHVPSFPVIDLVKERHDMWLLKRYGLPFMYWNFMLRGLA